MREIAAFCLLLACLGPLAARPVGGASAQELFDKADLVIVARAVANRDTGDSFVNPSGVGGPTDGFSGVDTDLEIGGVFKGDRSLRKIVFHHFRLKDHNRPVANGPLFVEFPLSAASGIDTWYLLFLKRNTDGRCVPVINQMDPWGRDVVAFSWTLGFALP